MPWIENIEKEQYARKIRVIYGFLFQYERESGDKAYE
jgi:hypothetical protein